MIILNADSQKYSGVDICRTLKRDSVHQIIPIIVMTDTQGQSDSLSGLESGANEIFFQPVDLDKLLLQAELLIEMKKVTDQLEKAEEVLIVLAKTLHARDDYTGGHVDRVTRVALMLGEKFSLPNDTLEDIRKGGGLHDIGKIGTPDAILLKPGKLNAEEYDRIKKHSRLGYEICSRLKCLGKAPDLILNHHEKLDGSGYPRGLKAAEIDLPTRIMTVSDIFDALTSCRSYRKSLPMNKVFENLWRDVKKGCLDGNVVEKLCVQYASGN